MAIPDFQSLMLPILKFARDGKEHGIAKVNLRVHGWAVQAY